MTIEPNATTRSSVPVDIPKNGEWYVRINSRKGRFSLAVYRRHMKTIGYLGQIDRALGIRVTTRKWTTILAVARLL